MKIIVNDANILIDLIELKILPYFFTLNFKFQTIDLILDELLGNQKKCLEPYIDTKQLEIISFSGEIFSNILLIQKEKPNLSIQDCSVFYQAQKENSILITSDKVLSGYSRINHVEVHGHLWIFDFLVSEKIMTGKTAIAKLKELCTIVNPKLGLPEKECEKRIQTWGDM